MTVKNVSVEGEPVPFHQYINTIITDFHDEKENVKNSYLVAEKTERRKTRAAIITAAIAVIACIVLSIITCFQYRTYADRQIADSEQELNEFAQRFEHISPYNNGNITVSDNFITAADVQLENSVDLVDTVNMSFTLTWNGESYTAQITRDTMLNVILNDGSVKEYTLTEKTFPYSSSNLHIGKGNTWYSAHTSYVFPIQELYGVSIGDISYIKLVNVDIWVTGTGTYDPVIVGTGYEIELYNAE